MEEVIARLSAATGIDSAKVTQATGMILAFLEKEGPSGPVSQLVESIPGARDLVNATLSGESSGGGGLMGLLGNMMGHMSGGIAGLGGQLMGIGLDLGQIQTLAKELFAYASEKAGPEVVGEIAREVPGLNQFL